MPPSKNLLAAELTPEAAQAMGILSAAQVKDQFDRVNSRKLFGFTRKLVPQGLPTEPKTYIFSIHEYGEDSNLGPGFKIYTVPACPPDREYGDPCVIDPLNFFEEAKVDQTEHTFTSGDDIALAIMKTGPGMNASHDRRKVGWFISKHNPPKPQEVKAAQDIYTLECRRLLNEGNNYHSKGKLDEITDTHVRAARWLKQNVSWDKPLNKMVDCVGCFEPIRQGVPVHAVAYCGAVQPGMWKEAIARGMKTLEAAPEDVQEEILAERAAAKKPRGHKVEATHEE